MKTSHCLSLFPADESFFEICHFYLRAKFHAFILYICKYFVNIFIYINIFHQFSQKNASVLSETFFVHFVFLSIFLFLPNS